MELFGELLGHLCVRQGGHRGRCGLDSVDVSPFKLNKVLYVCKLMRKVAATAFRSTASRFLRGDRGACSTSPSRRVDEFCTLTPAPQQHVERHVWSAQAYSTNQCRAPVVSQASLSNFSVVHLVAVPLPELLITVHPY